MVYKNDDNHYRNRVTLPDTANQRFCSMLSAFCLGGDTMAKRKPKETSWLQQIQSQSYDMRYAALKRLSHRANSRLREIEKHGYMTPAYKMAMSDIRSFGTGQRFTLTNRKQGRRLSSNELNIQLASVISFLDNQSSTITGYRETLRRVQDKFREKGVIIPDNEMQDFLNFLNSSQFNSMSMRAPSDEIIDDFLSAFDEGFNMSQIMTQYGYFLNNSRMTFDQIADRRADLRKYQRKR